MGYFNQYPYQDNEELNLDYLLAKVAALKQEIIETNAQIDGFNELLVQKADKATTLYGYGITDAYTKTQVDNLLVLKADKANVYNKTEVDNLLLPKVNASDLATVATTGSYTDLINKPTIPAPQVNADWNANSGVAQILNKPTIPAAQVNADWNAVSGVAQILNKPTIPAAQVNADWNAVSGVAQILNKPANLFQWTLKQLNNEQDLTIKLNNVTFGSWSRYAVIYLCVGGGLLDFGIFLCITSSGIGNVTYNPIIQSSNPPSVRIIDIEDGKMSFTIRRTPTYDRMYASMPEGGITIT